MRKHQIALRNAVLLPGFLVASTGYVARYTVTRGDHPGPDGGITGDRSLREAREAAVGTPAVDVMVMGPGLYNATPAQADVMGQVAIAGAGPASTCIVWVLQSASVSIERLAQQPVLCA